jgi:uncharacterized protein YggT (Ycf19 family)
MNDDKLEREEAQRAANYEAVKSNIKSDVSAEFGADARTRRHDDNVERMADEMRARSISEIEETDQEVQRGRVVARISQVIDYIFFLIYGLLAIRLILALFAAREGNDFVQFIRSITDPLYAPFKGIVPSISSDGFTLALPLVIAIIVYMMLHLAINGLLRMFVHRKVSV